MFVFVARAPVPNANAALPPATDPAPTATALLVFASELVPMAIVFVFVARAPVPNANAALPLATDPPPIANDPVPKIVAPMVGNEPKAMLLGMIALVLPDNPSAAILSSSIKAYNSSSEAISL